MVSSTTPLSLIPMPVANGFLRSEVTKQPKQALTYCNTQEKYYINTILKPKIRLIDKTLMLRFLSNMWSDGSDCH